MHSTLTTERLILRPLEAADAEDLYDAYRRPEAMRFMDDAAHTSAAETKKMVDGMLDGPGTVWTVRTTEDGPALGYVDYIGNAGVPGMGYFLHPDHWGNGYMSEAVRGALDYGFDKMELDRVELWISEENTASVRLAERVGFRRRGRMRQKYHQDSVGHDKIVYGITKEQWRTGQLAGDAQAAYSLAPILAVPDVLAAAEFYCDKLGFTIGFLFGDPPTHAGIHRGEWTNEGAHIQLTLADQPLAPKPQVGFYVFMGEDVDGLFARYQAAGVHIERELTDEPWGMREFAIRDCNGYLLRFGRPS
ncbi:MAG: GNAT family N-acetyltransferase [Caldilineaceae bacterium]|nr:GNAT family N-acetyltransferase [Caldilineaceae bacterium]